MILSNPLPQTQYQNNNTGGNPYVQQMAGILQAIMAQDAAAAAAQNSKSSQQSGLLSQMAGIGKLFSKTDNSATSPTTWQNAPAPDGSNSEIPAGLLQTNYGMDDVGRAIPTNYTPATPSKGFSEMLPSLIASAKAAYPDNPNMQKVAMSQAVLESGLTGNPSALATQNNNYFGIKASSSFPGTAGTVDYGTTEYVGGQPASMNQGFAANNSMLDSFKQHANLMYGANRYQPVIQSQTPEDAFNALQRAGYATDPNYANKLRSIYGRYIAPAYSS